MRFRHKLTIMLVVLALVPLVASALLAASLVRQNQVSQVDGRISSALSGATVGYSASLSALDGRARAFADTRRCARRAARRRRR